MNLKQVNAQADEQQQNESQPRHQNSHSLTRDPVAMGLLTQVKRGEKNPEKQQ
jgi:hypothetical protein